MEAVLLHGSVDNSPYKFQYRNPNKSHHPHHSFNTSHAVLSDQIFLFPPPHFHGGLLHAPPPPFLSHSYPPFSPHKPPQPPLLPLPVAANPRRSSAAISRGLSLPPATIKKTNFGTHKTTRDSSITPKKSTKHYSPTTRKAEEKTSSPIKRPAAKLQGVVGSSKNHLGPDPKELPKAANVFSGSAAAFAISPPPSSLPLPNFSLRPKKLISCKAEAAAAAGVDTGATDDLRKLLRLR